jgi:hypothetical protein
MTDALAVRSDEGEARWWLGALAVIKATAADTGGDLTVMDVTDPPAQSTSRGRDFRSHVESEKIKHFAVKLCASVAPVPP